MNPDDCLCGCAVRAVSGYCQHEGGPYVEIRCVDCPLKVPPVVVHWPLGEGSAVRRWNAQVKRLARDPATIRALARQIDKLRMKIWDIERK